MIMTTNEYKFFLLISRIANIAKQDSKSRIIVHKALTAAFFQDKELLMRICNNPAPDQFCMMFCELVKAYVHEKGFEKAFFLLEKISKIYSHEHK